MTRKHYKEMAEEIGNTMIGMDDHEKAGVWAAVGAMMRVLRAENERFDGGRFINAIDAASRSHMAKGTVK